MCWVLLLLRLWHGLRYRLGYPCSRPPVTSFIINSHHTVLSPAAPKNLINTFPIFFPFVRRSGVAFVGRLFDFVAEHVPHGSNGKRQMTKGLAGLVVLALGPGFDFGFGPWSAVVVQLEKYVEHIVFYCPRRLGFVKLSRN